MERLNERAPVPGCGHSFVVHFEAIEQTPSSTLPRLSNFRLIPKEVRVFAIAVAIGMAETPEQYQALLADLDVRFSALQRECESIKSDRDRLAADRSSLGASL